jgi:hypothetical protein
MKKQTATNNKFLKETKRIWAKGIFKKASEILNNEGETKARAYVQTFSTKPLSY